MLLLVAVAWLAYLPGLRGGFLFDDFANLPTLGETGPVNNWATFARYVTSGNADPTGRPLSVVSFLIDARDWPADPYPFKRTNLIIHLVNGLLLYTLLVRLGNMASRDSRWKLDARRVSFAAVFGAGAWLLHPFFVSTTLYIVQREAMLPAMFTLLGLLGWLYGRDLLEQRKPGGAIVALVSVAGCTLLGVMAKANGILLPVLVLVVEYTLARPVASESQPGTLRSSRVFYTTLGACWLAFAAILLGLFYVAAQGIVHGLDHRPWTTIERLLTEPRILFDYLGSLWLPHPYTAGVFNDTTAVSTSLLHPWSTLPSLALVVAGTVLALTLRRAAPSVSLAWTFFVAAHLIESTSIPLELYFEHRNYLAALPMFWPLGLWLSGARLNPSSASATKTFPGYGLRAALSVIILAGLAAMTLTNAAVWGDTSRQAELWAKLNPSSPRAQVSAAQEEISRGQSTAALARLEPMLALRPDEVQVAFNIVAARCSAGGVRPADVSAAARSIATTGDPGSLIASWYDRVVPSAIEGTCPGLNPDALIAIATAGLANPRLSAGRHQDLEHVIGTVRLAQRRSDEALEHFDKAVAFDPREAIALRQAAELGSAGYPSLGMRHLMTYDALARSRPPTSFGMASVHAWVLERQNYWAVERKRLESNLRADMGSAR